MVNPRVVASLAAASVLSACAVGPDYQRPDLTRSVDAASASASQESAHLSQAWWRSFNDPLLNQLVEQALAQNLDIRLAAARIREARALHRGSQADLGPELSLAAAATRRGGAGSQLTEEQYQLGFDARWELDLFGGLRRQRERSQAELAAVQADYAAARLSLLAEVSRADLELRLYQNQAELARQNAEAQAATARITQLRYQEGVTSRLDVERAQATLANTQAQVPASQEQAQAALQRLAFLLAQPVGQLPPTLAQLQSVPLSAPPQALAVSLASIQQRPDVLASEQRLAAATAGQGMATAARYPQLTLSGLLGWDSADAGRLFSNSEAWSLGAGLLLPLVDFGRLRAAQTVADARQAQALISYERSVRQAVQEADTALYAYARGLEQQQALQRAAEAARKASDIARKQYKEGVLSQLEVLDAERSQYAAELSLAQAQANLALRQIALYKALGWGVAELGADDTGIKKG